MRAVFPNKRRGHTLEKGDLLLEKSGGGDLQPVGAVMLYDHGVEAVCSNFIARMTIAPDWNSRFLVYLHAHLYAGRVNTKSIKQTTGIQNIDSMAYLNERVVYPTPPEQRAIAAFLDRKTTHIDAIIAKKERQVELFQEKRAALISHAVTKGLDPTVPMKDSGIEWLGEIPKRWKLVRLKHTGRIIGGFAFKSGDFLANGEVRVIKISNIQHMAIDLENLSYLPESYFTEYEYYSATDGDLIFALTRPIISTGIKASIVRIDEREKILINQRTGIFKPSKRIITKFMYYLVNSNYFVKDFSLRVRATNQPNISTDDIAEITIALPSLDEQERIVEHLDHQILRLDTLVAKARSSIETLREYRTALISAAVTGKIDVREARLETNWSEELERQASQEG
jgi:type I restriction enzyme S subunit